MKKVMLLILDGLGLRDEEEGNAFKQANTPVLDRLMKEYPFAKLEASGEYVGLPKGQMGNSEVGHMTIGSGRTSLQNLSLINNNIKTKEIFENQKLKDIYNLTKEKNGVLHLIGMFSNGNVHSSVNHLYALLAVAKLQGIKKVYLHLYTDGRDMPPRSAKNLLNSFLKKIDDKLGIASLGTICGRYYGMDRDNKWDRVKKSYDAMVYGIGNAFPSADQCIETHYKNGITDEFINASVIDKNSMIKDNDTLLFFNFRPDRMKQIITCFNDPNFKMFNVKHFENISIFTLFNIYEGVNYIYDDEEMKNTFGEYIASLGYKQARIAETEKYNHITFFFDGGKKLEDTNCDKILIPSPNVPTYDMKPEMSVGEVTEATLKAMEEDYDFIAVNFANPDMVGHTGNFKAVKDAIEICDFCVGKIVEKAQEQFFELVITADHGNAEQMIGDTLTTHTTNKVPFIICNDDYKIKEEGSLRDIIPTIIKIFEIKKPEQMSGESLIIEE